MRKVLMSLEDVKLKILALKGSQVEMNVNRGRKKIEAVSGVIRDVYPSVFTIETSMSKIQTFSYFDVLCGNVKLKEIEL